MEMIEAYTLWWVSQDKGGCLCMGVYATEDEARGDVTEKFRVLLEVAGGRRDEIESGTWEIENGEIWLTVWP